MNDDLKGMTSDLFLCYLHVDYEQVSQLRENGRKEILKVRAFSEHIDELKHGKYGALLTYDLSIRVTHLIRQEFRVHHCI